MRFSLNFVKEYLDIDVSPPELASLLTMSGMEVEHLQEAEGDWIFDIEVTTNRYDWLSILGIAREIAAVLGKRLKVKHQVVPKEPLFKERKIIIKDSRDCPYYVGRLIKGVKVDISSDWLKKHIVNCGISSVNDIVDITNYCMLKWGNPLHAFDNDRIEGNIYIRRAGDSELFLGIDGRQRILNKENLVIADDRKVIALAGVMGAKNTEVGGSTKNVFLEAAVFSPVTVRRSRRAAGIDTESSYRFERKVNFFYLENASYEAAKLIGEKASGGLKGCQRAGKSTPALKKKISISLSQLKAYLGADFSKTKVKAVLGLLDFEVEDISKDKLAISPPSFRFDIEREVDVYEEFARIYGYNKIPAEIPFLTHHSNKNILASFPKNFYHFKNKLRAYVALLGFKEIITYSLESQEELNRMGEKGVIKVSNPLRRQENTLRTTLLLGMIKSLRHNLNRNQSCLWFFEIADIYHRSKKGFREMPVLSLGISGKYENFFYLKRAIEEILGYLDIGSFKFKEANFQNSALAEAEPEGGSSPRCREFLPGFANVLEVVLKKKAIGFLGKLSRGEKQNFDLKEDLFFAQLDLLPLIEKPSEKEYEPFSLYPVVWRDISMFLHKSVKFRSIEEIIRKTGSYLVDLRIVDTYEGRDLPSECSAFTLRLFYQSQEKTLISQEVDAFHNSIREKLSEKEGVGLR